jgi:hypothetical protein
MKVYQINYGVGRDFGEPIQKTVRVACEDNKEVQDVISDFFEIHKNEKIVFFNLKKEG